MKIENLIADPESRGFSFNGDNKQTKVTHNGNKIAEYFFDGEGKRVKKKVFDDGDPVNPTEETVFVYSNGKLIAEYSTAQPPPNPTTSYTATDQLGSPRIITDQFGQVTSRRDFLPFGEQIDASVGNRGDLGIQYSGSADNVRQKFTGYQKDNETSLDFAEARMYDNRFARFAAVDPLLSSGKSASPQTFNRYIYVGNNPLMITDPSGLSWYRMSTGNKDQPWQYQWFSDNPGGDWKEVDFGDNVFSPISDWHHNGVAMGTGYLDRYSNRIFTEEEYKKELAAYQAFQPGGDCYSNPQCAGIRNAINDNQSIFEAQRFTSGFGIGGRNELKSLVDVPNWNFAPLGANMFIDNSLHGVFGVHPWFNYETPRPGSESVGAFVGARAVDVASFVAIEKIGNFASNPFAIRGGTGLFGRRGLSLGRVKIDALYENPNAGGGTYFSIRRGNNFLRFDRGYLHGTQKVRNHMQFRLTVRGTTFGGTNQQRALYPPFRLF